MSPENLNSIPLLFSFAHVVGGDGFLAGVRMNGRALLEVEECCDSTNETWITGIAPVGIAGGGKDRDSAFRDFREAWVMVLFDIAKESTSFDEFRKLSSKFLESRQDALTKLWDNCVDEVRRRKYTDPELRKGDADASVKFEIVDLSKAKNMTAANANSIDQPAQVAA